VFFAEIEEFFHVAEIPVQDLPDEHGKRSLDVNQSAVDDHRACLYEVFPAVVPGVQQLVVQQSPKVFW